MLSSLLSVSDSELSSPPRLKNVQVIYFETDYSTYLFLINVLLDFDGNGGFKVEVYINDEHEVSGEYKFKEGQGYIKSRYFAFKHGVYSANIFPYVLNSVMKMERIK